MVLLFLLVVVAGRLTMLMQKALLELNGLFSKKGGCLKRVEVGRVFSRYDQETLC